MKEKKIENKTLIKTKSKDKKLFDQKLTHHPIHKKRFSQIIDSSSPKRIKRFESLIKIQEDSIIHDTNLDKHNTTFTLDPKVKKILMNEYKQEIKREKKNRKLKIIPNLSDSFQSSEGSSEEGENMGFNFYISSESYFILTFDCLLLFFSLFSIIFIPLNLAERKYFCKKEKTLYILFQFITEILYIIDFIISFFRSYYNYKYKKITKINQIIKHYIKTGFIPDFLSAFPSYSLNRKFCLKKYNDIYYKFNLIPGEIISCIILVFKILKILKALHHKRNKFIETIYEKISEYLLLEQILDMIIYSIKIFSFLHTLICVHIFIGEQFHPNWMTHINIQSESLITKYISSFYFIIETMTTVGYGDIVSISFLEMIFQIILLSIGIVSYSFIVTKFGNYIMKKSQEETELDEKKLKLEEIRIQYPLMPFKLYIKIQEYLSKKAYKTTNKKKEIKKLLDNLPEQLRNELLLIINKDIIKNFLIFKDCKNTDFITKTLSCFIQAICKKETILISEGQQVENIIFVKDGRLILEATIDLMKPYESYKKYFKENFKHFKFKQDNNDLLKSKFKSNILEDNINIENLKSKLDYVIQNLKLGIRNSSNYNISYRKSSNLFQINKDKITDEKNNSNNSDKDDEEEEGKYQYLKILDIRKNEHFGNLCMFLEKPAPLTLIVKSKIAEIFALRKKDAITISNLHHNIINRIHEKSYKNLLSIKKKTFQVLKNYFNLNNFNKAIFQDESWFNEKSREVIFQDITNFINNTILKSEKSDIAETTVNFPLKDILSDVKLKSRLSQATNNYNKFNILNNIKKNDNNDNNKKINNNFLSSKWMPKIRKSINMPRKSFIPNLSPNFMPKILIKNNEVNPYKKKSFLVSNISEKINIYNTSNDKKEGSQTNNTNNTTPNLLNIKNKQEEIVYSKFNILSKETNKEISEQNSIEMTMREEMLTLNNLNNDVDLKLRKKIKTSVKRDKIIKLSKIQNHLINSYQEGINIPFLNDELNNQILNNFKKISELNKTLYSNLMEYFETDCESETEIDNKKIEQKTYNIKNGLIIDKNININIQASYYNLNSLTKGKIIKDDKYKSDIKLLIEKYINQKKKFYLNLIKEYIKFHTVKKFKEENVLKKNFTKNENKKTNNNDDTVQFIKNKKNEDLDKNNKFIPKFPRRSKTKKPNLIEEQKIISHKIKKTKTNNKEVFKNFKEMNNDGISSHLKLKSNFFKKKLNTLNFGIVNKNNIEQNNDENHKGKESSNMIGKMIDKIFSLLQNK